MTAVPTAGDGGAAVAPGAPDLGAARVRASVLTSSDAAGAVGAFLFSFVLLFMLSVNSAGYWPTAWSWMTLALLFLCAVILILQTDVRISRFEAVVRPLYSASPSGASPPPAGAPRRLSRCSRASARSRMRPSPSPRCSWFAAARGSV